MPTASLPRTCTDASPAFSFTRQAIAGASGRAASLSTSLGDQSQDRTCLCSDLLNSAAIAWLASSEATTSRRQPAALANRQRVQPIHKILGQSQLMTIRPAL